ncbi:MAG: SDR family NAD(P)-dependent oxidoreductase [Rhodospirillales bacterium]
MTDDAVQQFDSDLVKAFAEQSGDYNPIHVDAIAARRLLYGGCIVHGALLTWWALALVAERIGKPVGLTTLKASFKSPVMVGETVSAEPASDGDNWTIRIRRGDRLVARVDVTTGDAEGDRLLPPRKVSAVCRELGDNDMADASGGAPLAGGDPSTSFPALGLIPVRQTAIIAAASRIVGMECPGRHSVFSELRLTFAGAPDDVLSYRVRRWEPRFRMVSLALSGAATGEITAFVRPSPVAQPSISSLSGLIRSDLFAGARALVVGGSRGLGELLAKLFVTAGGAATLTYARGIEDARKVADDINRTFPDRATTTRFDVTAPDLPALSGPYTHVFYCASPKILAQPGDTWSDAEFQRYRKVYVDGLRVAVERAAAALVPDAFVVNLSSVYAEDPPAAFAEYGKAKAESERTCLEAAARAGLTGVNWRLPRLRTDQTQSLTPEDPDDPLPVLIARLENMAAAARR